MASPFQQFPALDEYCAALAELGGSAEVAENEWGSFRRLVSPDGNQVIVAELDSDECLTPSLIENLDSRLGIVSRWNPSSG